jgi:hypothetical protein
VPLGRNRARPSRTVWARPAATRAHGPRPRGRIPCSSRWRGPALPPRATRGARRPCTMAALLSEPTAARCRRTGDGRGTGGSPARGRRRDATSTGERWAARRRTASVALDRGGLDDELVGTAAWSARRAAARVRRSGGGERASAVGAGLSGCAACCPDSGLKVHVRCAARCHAGPVRHARLIGGAHSSAISKLKNHPDENSSNKIARN